MRKHEVVLFNEDHSKEGPYRYTKATVVGTYYIDIFPDDTEKVIRKKLVDLFKKKLPLTSENRFEFVKSNRATILNIKVTENFNWNFTYIKALVGQGRLYTRLIIPVYTLQYQSGSDLELHSDDQTANAVHPQGSENISIHPETEKMLDKCIHLIEHRVQTTIFQLTFLVFLYELLDANTPEISENFTSIEDSLL